MKRNLFIVVTSILALLSSCAAPRSWSQTMSLWPGESEDQVYLIYGAPTRSQTLSDGRKVATYEFKWSFDGDLRFGEVTFGFNQGRVTNASFKGHQTALRGNIKRPTDRPVIK
ncbi:hypothetical protein [Sphingobacterium deserti]|uniref:Lipoprotein n=1 Tax=Sphingobacterium deserti TaxID=1229276 RepID=A0A0B8T5K1_9SPHI|nr:hypothetical protein [Sphingobacterium deserti]KGE15883.1 hypothetical protein DI53_0317 [Sphingobacterium deserti]